MGSASAPVDTHDFIVKSEHIETVEKVKLLEFVRLQLKSKQYARKNFVQEQQKYVAISVITNCPYNRSLQFR